MSTLIIPVGIPGSGKSTYIRNTFPDAYVASSDQIRLDLFGSLEVAHEVGKKAANNAQVFEEFHTRIAEALQDGNDAVADATNLNADARYKLRTIATRVAARTHLIYFQNPAQAVKQNKQRAQDAIVPDAAMVYMLLKYIDSYEQIPREHYSVTTYIDRVAIR